MNRKVVDKHIEKLRQGKLLDENEVKALCDRAKQILSEECNVVRVQAPATVPISFYRQICGDIHGQFEDLLELFRIGGQPPYTNYIFMGDYVDRGHNSVETFLFLIALKVRYRNRITLLRGNHESRIITQVYGFYDECMKKYGSLNVWRYCTDLFDYLTISALVEDKIFCVHGGLSPNIKTIDEIRGFDRIKEIPQEGAICDLLWSDPEDSVDGWSVSNRGAGYLFGKDPVELFSKTNNISLITRAHQLVMEGYKYMFGEKLATVWSAPNYYYKCGNVASILELDENLQRYYKIFEAAPLDNKLPGVRKVASYFL